VFYPAGLINKKHSFFIFKMKIAAIDIGTNSTRLLVSLAEKSDGSKITFVPILREMKITRLGKNLEHSGKINAANSALTIEVLKEYQGLLKSHNVSKYRAVGTRVLRQAENSGEFVNRVFLETGLDVEIISGSQEAELSFSGAVKGFVPYIISSKDKKVLCGHGTNKEILVVDVGGGSTEFILGSAEEGTISYLNSVDIGSVTLSEKFLPGAIPDDKSVTDLLKFIEDKLKNTVEEISQSGFAYMAGLAGTISSLSAVDLEIEEYDRDKIHGYILYRDRVIDIFKRFCSVDLKTRKKIKGLEPARADIIIGGTALLIKILEMFGLESLIVSENDLLDGIVYSLLS
jgi:exopolyphosphatase / guanosine-5'-triphosphate,3'-diphosphate pyrophosphatase